MKLTYTLPAEKVEDGGIVLVRWRMTAIQREQIANGQPMKLMIVAPGAPSIVIEMGEP